MESLEGASQLPAPSNIATDENTNVESMSEACEKIMQNSEKNEGENPVELSEIEDVVGASQEETDDEDDDEEIKQFFSLMNKAERRNQRKTMQKQNQFSGPKSDWRTPQLGDPDEDTTDTEDEDDNQETRKFMGLMQAAKIKNQKPKKSSHVNIKWSNGKVQVTNLPPNIRVTRVAGRGEDLQQQQDDLISQRRRELQSHRQTSTNLGGKRKFEDRMTLTEAKVGDFEDTKDYVDFIQAKLKNVNIKLIK